MMRQARARVGVHGRNDHEFGGRDFDLMREAGIESVKVMSFHPVQMFFDLLEMNPDLGIIVRLYDGRMGPGRRHPTPGEFAETFVPVIRALPSFVVKFEVHNEPNHLAGIEGWGQEDEDAADFCGWFLEVYDRLKEGCPGAQLGFPGLAIPHRDLEWLEVCRQAVERADFLGCHSYWQNPTSGARNHLEDVWGLRFKAYHRAFPDHIIEITEFGNSNGQGGYAVDHDRVAREYVEFYQEVFKYPYVGSANAFLMSAPQSEWGDFVWREESGAFRPVVGAVGAMERPALFEEVAPGPGPAPAPSPPGGDWVEEMRRLGVVVGMLREPRLVRLPSGKVRDLAFCMGTDPGERDGLQVRWAYGYRVEVDAGTGTVAYRGESVEALTGEDARVFAEALDRVGDG